MTTPIRTPADLIGAIQELLPHNTLLGRSDDLPKEFKEGYVITIGDVVKNDEQSGISECCATYEQTLFVDYMLQIHRDDWVVRTSEKQQELLAALQYLHPRFYFQTFEEPQVESADTTYVRSRSTWAFNYEL